MSRARTTLVALAAVLVTAAASGLGVAQADDSSSPTTTTTAVPNTIVVNGTDTITIDPASSDATQESTYQTALGGAITDAESNAALIASQIGATLGAISNVTETSDSSNLCQGPIMLPATAKPGTSTSGKAHHPKGATVTHALRGDTLDVNCSVEADVTVTYEMTPA